MLKPEQVTTKAAPRPAVAATATATAAVGPPQRCVLCGRPCHAAAVHGEAYEVQDCHDCGRNRRDPALARKAFA